MNEHTRDLRVLQAELVLQVGDDGVDAAHRQIIGQRAVAVHLDGTGGAAIPPRDRNLVDVKNLREMRRRSAQLCFEILGGLDRRRVRDGCWFALDVRQQRGNARHLAANVGLEFRGDLVRAAQNVDKKLITGVTVFDVYEGKGIDDGKKSIAIAVTIQPREKTMTDQEIEAVAAKIVAEINKKTGGTLR